MPWGDVIEWSDEFALLELDEPVAALLGALGPEGPYYVLLRRNDASLYVWLSEELLRRPEIRKFRFVAVPPELTIGEAIDLPEAAASRRAGLDGAPLPDHGVDPVDTGLRVLPTRERWVAVDPGDNPVAVGESVDRITLGGDSRPQGIDLDRFAFVGAAPGAPVDPPESVGPNEGRPKIDGRALVVETPASPSGTDEGTDPVRHPSLQLDRGLEPGGAVALTVDLLRTPSDPETQSQRVAIEGLEEDWTEILVDVEVHCAAIRFERSEGTIRVRRNADSVPAVFTGVVEGTVERDQSVRVTALFSFGGRDCGIARRSWTVEGDVAAQTVGDTPPPLVMERAVEAPVLTVRILKPDPARPGSLLWSLVVPRADLVPDLPPHLAESIDLGADPERFVAGLYGAFAGVSVGQHEDVFRGFGDELWERTPTSFRKTYWALRSALGPGFTIQFVTDDPHVPWELMRPFDDASGTVGEILALAHPVARWIGVYEGSLRQRLARGRVATIAPKYASVMDELPRAQEEAELLTSEYHAVAIPATLEGVRLLLRSGIPEPVAILHFAGHGEFPAGLPSQSTIKLEDGSLSAMAVKVRETTLGERDGPLVVFNACKVGATGEVLGASGGWADVFLERRFRGFVAPLWPVYDDDAALVVRELFEALVTKGEPVGKALQELRARHAERSPTFFAYLYFGDVNARLPQPRA